MVEDVRMKNGTTPATGPVTGPANGDDGTIVDAPAAAEQAGLVYVSDEEPGIRRRRSGKGFSFRNPDGTPDKDKETLDRIKSLAIPPAYTDVWICADPNGHIQATGRDDKGRERRYSEHTANAQRCKIFSAHLALVGSGNLRRPIDAPSVHHECSCEHPKRLSESDCGPAVGPRHRNENGNLDEGDDSECNNAHPIEHYLRKCAASATHLGPLLTHRGAGVGPRVGRLLATIVNPRDWFG